MAWASSFEAFFKNFKRESKILSEETVDSIKYNIEKNNLQRAVHIINNALREIKEAPLNIAVTGETGTGKSTFINALRGLKQDAEDAAPTGVTETTMKRTPYPQPKLPKVTVWDLPGIGSTNFTAENYLTEMKFGEYDFFIIISSERFKENDAQLAKVIAKTGMNFYFVRTKVDASLRSEREAKPTSFNEDSILNHIRENCSQQLRNVLPHEVPLVFLVNSLKLSEYDFPKLETQLLSDLPAHKRHAFSLCLRSLTEEAIKLKRDVLKQSIFLEALKDGVLGFIPFVGLLREELENLDDKFNFYRSCFGLDDASLENIAQRFNMSKNEFKQHLRFPHLFAEDEGSLRNKLLNYATKISLVSGGLIATVLYFEKSYYLQYLFLETAANDALALLNKEGLFEKEGPYVSNPPDFWE